VGRAGTRGDRGRVDLDYLDHLRVERALSPNTLEAYGRDLARLAAHAQNAKRSLLDLRQSDLTDFIGSLREQGLSARSRAPSMPCAASSASRCAKDASRAIPWRTCSRRAPSPPCPGT
jgi:site-specific recombinase XerC